MGIRLRAALRNTARSEDGRSVIRLGVCVGYWPCLRAPFLQVGLGRVTLDIWFGMPSYKGGATCPAR